VRILHTAHTYAPLLDGVAEVVRHISEGLVRRGHEVHVATRAVASQPAEEIVNGVSVRRFSVSGNLAVGMKGEVREYQEFVRAGGWDLMVNHCLQTWSTDALLEWVGSFPWASLLVTHGLSTENQMFREYYRKMPKFIPRYSAWVSVSALNEESAYANQHGLNAPRVIRNGVDLQEWNDSLLNLREAWNLQGHPWLINVSNHSHEKRHDWSFQLAERLKGTNAKLTIVGNSHMADRWQLGRLGIRGGCYYECRMRAFTSRSVQLKTAIARREVVSAIKEADLLVSTSRREANSIVLLESMAAGTPWISTDVGSARENAGGIVVSSVDKMAEAVLELLRDPDRRKCLGQEGRIRVGERHDWNRIVDSYEQLYEGAIGQPIHSNA
jgi:glycosyltransferase involved in cell wall biosynthesis